MATETISINTPGKYHSAYSPIFFDVLNTENPLTTKDYNLKLTINYKGSREDVNLVRPFVRPKQSNSGMPGLPGPVISHAIFDVSGVVRNFFEEKGPSMINDVEVDKRLFVYYSCAGVTYVALNAASMPQLTSEDLKYGEKLLSALPIFRRYVGYDFDVSFLCGDIVQGVFQANSVNRVKPRAIPVRYLQDEKENYIQDEQGNYIRIDGVNIIDMPIPRNPFYVRWINRLGGVDYWMFGNSQEITVAAKDAKTLLSYPAGNNTTFGIEADRSIVVGASGVLKKEWDVLSLLPLSPQIEWYNEEIGQWVIISVGKSENVINTNRSLHDVEFTFNLPTLQTQFA